MTNNSTSSDDGYFSQNHDKIIVATFTCLTAFVLFLTFFIAVTRFRLWHSNRILVSFPKLVEHPLTWLISFCIGRILDPGYKNDLYNIWMMVLTIAYDNVITISSGSSPGFSWLIQEYISLFNSLYVIYFIFREGGSVDPYYVPLLILWSLFITKFLIRQVLNKLVESAYGLNNSKLVSDYMKIEHELTKPNEVVDPKHMKGYKYLVLGEGKINPQINNGPDYTPEIELPPGVVTLDKVWNCKERLLDPSIDTDNRLRDVCLSFAFFKLLKRRFFEYPAAEAQLEKTRQLVFDGLLSRNIDSIYRVIAMEIAFLRDFFYTRYPVTFALGVPVLHVTLLVGMFGVSLWISVKSFKMRQDPQNDYLWSFHQRHNIDYTITNILLILITIMEALETLIYVFSDWTKVIFICGHVRRWMPHHHCFFDKVLAILCTGKFSRSLNNTIGQYSLLENSNRFHLDCWSPVTCIPYSTWWWSPSKVAPNGMKKRKAVVLSPYVKGAIVGSLRSMSHYPTKGVASLRENKVYDDLAWTCTLKTEFHTLIVWHIATGLCEIQPVKNKGNKESVEPYHPVASHLSNYCAYLMVFLPDMLPESIFSLKLFFHKVLTETKEFFRGARNYEDKYSLMLKVGDSGNGVIDMGARLAKYLMEIPDDVRRWKIMADFWSEFIIFLAPCGKESEHLKNLESGGEFITHLWALLYHAGIVHDTATASSGHHP